MEFPGRESMELEAVIHSGFLDKLPTHKSWNLSTTWKARWFSLYRDHLTWQKSLDSAELGSLPLDESATIEVRGEQLIIHASDGRKMQMRPCRSHGGDPTDLREWAEAIENRSQWDQMASRPTTDESDGSRRSGSSRRSRSHSLGSIIIREPFMLDDRLPPMPLVALLPERPPLQLAPGSMVLLVELNADDGDTRLGVVKSASTAELALSPGSNVDLFYDNCHHLVLPWLPITEGRCQALRRDIEVLCALSEIGRRARQSNAKSGSATEVDLAIIEAVQAGSPPVAELVEPLTSKSASKRA